jgi:membrane protein
LTKALHINNAPRLVHAVGRIRRRVRRVHTGDLCDKDVMKVSGRIRGIYAMGRQAISCWIDHNASSTGAALAFYTLFAVAPVLIIAVALASTLLGENSAQARILDEMRSLLGNSGASAVSTLLASADYQHKSARAATIGLITLLIGATSVFGELQNALNTIWQTPPRTQSESIWQFVRVRILSFGMILGLGFLMLVSLVVSASLATLSGWFGNALPGWTIVLAVLNLVVGFALTTLVFSMIYKYMPREQIAWGDVWIGSLVTALLFTVGKVLIGLYLGRNAFTSTYGAAGSFVVLLLWVYYSAQIFLLGAEFTHIFAYQRGSRFHTES